MYIKKCFLKNFRNYSASVGTFSDGINLVIGANAQGKTNLLESIYFCALGKSPKTNKERNLIQYNKRAANISLNFMTNSGEKNIDVNLSNMTKKSVKINGVNISRLSSLIGELKVVYFSPDELRLIKDVPEDRRRFLDISISQIDKEYFFALTRYEKVIKQRNAILKKHLSPEITASELAIWTPQFLMCAEIIIEKRLKFVEKLKIVAEKIHNKLCDKEKLKLEYSYIKPDNISIAEDLKRKLENSIKKELEMGFTIIGPHRDDIKFSINDKDCRYFSSQGQQRTVALSLKLAEMEIAKEQTGEYPVLLLDDVMSELDETREKNLYNIIKNYQSIITSTKDNFDGDKKLIIVKNGNIKS